jgi:LmbE family N-acetylglucosaminyl deacetylase
MSMEPTRVLLIAAHPDDTEFSSGGTVAEWVRQGREVYYLVCTRGDKGSADPEMLPGRLMKIREAEQRAAAEVLGVKQVGFLNFRDGELAPTLELRGEIVHAIRKIRPDVVLTHDPATLYSEEFINHPDHRAVGQAALDAIYPTARDRLQFPEHLAEGLEPHKVKEIYLWGSLRANHWVDITPAFDRKVQALVQHESQISDPSGIGKRMRERASALGQPHGIDLAEAFFRIVMAR